MGTDQPGAHAALGVFSAEGSTFTAGHAMNADNKIKTAAMLCTIWDGSVICRLRAADAVSILNGRRLAIHLMLQEDVANAFLSDKALRLLSRILVARPRSLAGTRLYREVDPNDEPAAQRAPQSVANGHSNGHAPAMIESAPVEVGADA